MKRRLLKTILLGAKARVLDGDHRGKAGIIASVFLWRGKLPAYTVMLKDGRLLDLRGTEVLVESLKGKRHD